jgi:hypothetical protein
MGSHEKLILSEELTAEEKEEIVTQVCQLQFRFPCFPVSVDSARFT